jgi:hypothetical protein
MMYHATKSCLADIFTLFGAMYVLSKWREGTLLPSNTEPNYQLTEIDKRSINLKLQEDNASVQSANQHACTCEEPMHKRARHSDEVARSSVSFDTYSGHQRQYIVTKFGRPAVAKFEPAAWTETPAEHSEWIAMFDFLNE